MERLKNDYFFRKLAERHGVDVDSADWETLEMLSDYFMDMGADED